MHRRNRITSVAAAAAVAAALLAPALSASAADLCGIVITTPGITITLTEDLHCGDRGITVRADNVTIDLAGHTINGHPAASADPVLGLLAGVMVYRAHNTLVTGGAITGFTSGLTVLNGSATRVENLAVYGTLSDGMRLTDSTVVSLDSVTLTGPGPDAWSARGIAASEVRGFSAKSLDVSQWPDNGVLFELSEAVTITDSRMLNNTGAGVSLWQTDGRIELDHVVSDQNGEGITIAHTDRSGIVLVSNSVTRNNAGNGLHTTNATNARITNHTSTANGGEGIWMTSGIDGTYGHLIPYVATIEDSTASSNGHGGISMSDVGRWTLTQNRADDNGDSGFMILGGTATLTGNTATGNTHDGYTWTWEAHGTSTGDHAEGNTQNGVLVDTRSKHRVTLTDVTSTRNQLSGMQLTRGTVNVNRGHYYSNRLDGIQASSGNLFVKEVTAVKNGRNGIAYAAGTSGVIERVNSSKNARYGICIGKGPLTFVSDVPPHELLHNGIAPRGSKCVANALIIPRLTPSFGPGFVPPLTASFSF